MEPLRIMHVVTSMNRAGLETMLMNYYRHIDRDKLQFDFLTHRSEKADYDDEILSLGGRIYHVPPIHPLGFFRYRKSLKEFFDTHKEYMIVHSHIDALSTFPLMAAKKAGVPVRIAHSHTSKFDKDIRLPLRYLSKWILPGAANHFFGCSKSAVRFMFGKRIFQSKNFSVIFNAIDVGKFAYRKESRLAVRSELGMEDNFIIGHVGRFSRNKNHDYLLKVFSEVRKRDDTAKLLLIGEGEHSQRIRQLTAKLGVEDSVHFLGVRSDIPGLMHAMDVFLLPSRFEGLGLVLIEAQSAGLQCFASAGVVPDDANIAGFVDYISLDEPASTWAAAILERRKPQEAKSARTDAPEKVRFSGYEIKNAAEKLSNFYFAKMEER